MRELWCSTSGPYRVRRREALPLCSSGTSIGSPVPHTEFVDAFYRIAQDRENKIVILTGAIDQLKFPRSSRMTGNTFVVGITT